MGMANGLLYGFIFWFIADLNGSEIVMGLSIIVSCLMDIITFPISKKVIASVGGNMPAVTVSVLSYAVRFLGFSYITNPWYILILQLLHMPGGALFWAAAVYYATDLAPKRMTTTLLGILNGVHFGFVTGIATIIGGIVYRKHGGRLLYRWSTIMFAIWSTGLFTYLFLKK